MDKALMQIQENLELIKRSSKDVNSMEFWSARDLMVILGYSTWRQFFEAISRAKEACKVSNQAVENNFLPAPAKWY
jgi:DNA-damage-inducible protein D